MLNFKNLRVYGAVGLLVSSLTLGGCGSEQKRNQENIYKSDDLVAYYLESTNEMVINESNHDGFNGKTYRELIENYGSEFNKLSLNDARLFNFEHLEDVDINELSISIPNDSFNFNSISSIDGLEKLEIAVDESANIESLFNYLCNNDLSGIDLTIKLLDLSSNLSFTEQLKNHTINAASITISSEYTDFYKYIYNVRTPDLKISRICKTSGIGDIVIQLSKNTEKMYYEYVNDGENITMTINNLIISSNNNEVLVIIEKTNNLNLVISEDAKLSAPEGTTLEIDKENVLKLKEE